MPQKTNRKVLLLKIESTYGTDSVPTGAANAFEATNVNLTPMQSSVLQRNLDREYLGGEARILAGTHVALSFDVEIAGAGAVDTAPAYGPALRACGLAETITITTGPVEYDPVSASEESCSIYVHWDGTLHKIVGWRGNVTLSLSALQLPKFTFTGLGLLVDPAAAALPTGTYTAWQKPTEVSDANTTAATIHGFTSVAASLEIDLGNQIAYRNLVNSESVEFVDRDVTGTLVIEAPALGTQDFFAVSKAETLAALTFTHGVGAGNIVEITGPKVQILEPTYSDSDGINMMNLPLAFVPSTGNDEIQITTK